MGRAQRDKGRRGQTAAEALLKDLDWTVDPITSGIKREDLIATDVNGKVWSVEVKNCASVTRGHREQAIRQAAERKLPWMLMNKVAGTRCWLVQRQGCSPVIWAEKKP